MMCFILHGEETKLYPKPWASVWCVLYVCKLSEAMTAAGHDDSSPVEDGPEELAEVVTVMVLSVGQSQSVGTEWSECIPMPGAGMGVCDRAPVH
jgi:hypothetical protein